MKCHGHLKQDVLQEIMLLFCNVHTVLLACIIVDPYLNVPQRNLCPSGGIIYLPIFTLTDDTNSEEKIKNFKNPTVGF